MAYKKMNVVNKVLEQGVHYMTSDYKTRNASRPTHSGIDMIGNYYACDYEVSIADGVVESTGKDSSRGNYVRIKHANNIISAYYHIKDNTICVKAGQSIKKGQRIGYMGSTGNSTGAHLHLSIFVGSTVVDPLPYLTGEKTFGETTPVTNDIDTLAKEVIQGKYGNGDERKSRLGSLYLAVQKKVNELLSGKKTNEVVYIVKKGDTLTKIAKQYGTTIEKLVKDNNIKNKNLIYVGQKIVIK